MKLIVKKINQDELDKFIKENSINFPIEQTFIWQQFDNSISNRQALGIYGFFDNNTLKAVAAITQYTNRSYKWWWVKYGPIFSKNTTDDFKINALNHIKHLAKNSSDKIVFIRVTVPNIKYDFKEQLQHMIYDRTILINLSNYKNDDELISSYTRHGRYEVRQSMKKGVKCHKFTNDKVVDNFDKYYDILKETAHRDGFFALPKNTYIKLLNNASNNINFYVASFKNQPVSWAIVTNFNGYAKYYYAAGNSQARDSGAAYALQHFIMQDLLNNNVKTYDLMGIESDNFPELKSVTGFKKKFSKNITDIDKTYDIVCSPIRYSMIKGVKKAKKALKG